MTPTDIILRLGVAALIGSLVGLNRFVHHKFIGVRTLGLVSLGSAAIVAALVDSPDAAAVSRIIQGIITGIGFIGAGVIMRDDSQHRIIGLTTAATVWISALVGILCGLGAWVLVTGTAVAMTAVLFLGGPLEKWVARHHTPEPDDGTDV